MTVLPTVHLNGTSSQTLIDGYCRARSAISDAMEALREIEFNSRDYYPQGDDVWLAAVQERMEQFAALRKIDQQFVEVLTYIIDAGGNND